MLKRKNPYLGEADILRFLPEALTADVEAVFPDQSGLVGADAAERRRNVWLAVAFSSSEAGSRKA